MKMHPLFAGFTHAQLETAAHALGFEFRRLRAGDRASEQSKRSGFLCMGVWNEEGEGYAGYVRPLTAFAMACWLAGLGQNEQSAHLKRPERYSYRLNSERWQGQFGSREAAKEVGRTDAVQRGREAFKTAGQRPPLASSIYTGASVLEDLRVSAYAAFGDDASDWPRLRPDQSGLFCEAFALLVDGFAKHTDTAPTFAALGKVVEHRACSCAVCA